MARSNSTPSETLSVLHEVLIAAQQLTAQRRDRARMTPHEYAALQHITRHSDGLTPGRLGEVLAITSGSTTKLVDRLEARGLVRRRPHPRGDRRRTNVVPTPRGMALIRRDLKYLMEQLPTAASALTRNQEEAIARLIALGRAATELG